MTYSNYPAPNPGSARPSIDLFDPHRARRSPPPASPPPASPPNTGLPQPPEGYPPRANVQAEMRADIQARTLGHRGVAPYRPGEAPPVAQAGESQNTTAIPSAHGRSAYTATPWGPSHPPGASGLPPTSGLYPSSSVTPTPEPPPPSARPNALRPKAKRDRGSRRSPDIRYLVASSSLLAGLVLIGDVGSVFEGGQSEDVCQEIVQSDSVLSRDALSRLLAVPERQSKQAIRAIVNEPYCVLPAVEVRAGVTAQREAYPLAFDPQTWLVLLYEGDEYAGYAFSFKP